MQSEEDDNERRASLSSNAPDHQPVARNPEPELTALTSAALPAPLEAETRATVSVRGKNINLEELFVTQCWHRPYAEALMETDEASLPALIAVAERAILERYLELQLVPVPTDELDDLGHAVEALSQLKKCEHPSD